MNTTHRRHGGSALRFDPPPSEEASVDGAAWSSLARVLRRRALLISGVTMLLILMALPLIMSTTKTYYAQTRILVSPAPALTLTAGLDGREVGIEMQDEIERLLSKDVTSQVIARFDLASLPEFNEELKEPTELDLLLEDLRTTLRAAFLGSDETEDATASEEFVKDNVAMAFDKALTVSRQGILDVITVGFSAADPELAAAVPPALVETYLALREARWQREVGDAADWLDTRISVDRDRVSQMRSRIEETLDAEDKAKGADGELPELRLSTLAARHTDLRQAREEIATIRLSIEAALADPNMTALSEPEHLASLRSEWITEQRDLNRMMLTFGKNSEALRRKEQEISALGEELAAGLMAYDRSVALQDTALEARETELARDLAETRNLLAARHLQEDRIDRQLDDLRESERSLATLEYKRQLILAQARLTPVSLEVLSPARIPHNPTGPRRKLLLIGAAFAGLLLGLTLAALLELRDNSTRSHEQLAHLPSLVPVGLWPRVRSATRWKAWDRAKPDIFNAPDSENVREALLMLRSANGGRMPGVLTVSSPRARDMTVPVAEWIARELDAQGETVLLVNARGRTKPAAAERTASRDDSAPGSPLRRLQLRDLLDRANGDIELTLTALAEQCAADKAVAIIDAPPLLAAGTLEIARYGGDILLVLRWGQTPRTVVELCAGLLAKISVHQAFSLIVDAQPRRHRLYGFTDRLSMSESAG